VISTVVLMQGNFTGPKIFWSGSSFRTEATGYGLVSGYLKFSFDFHK
jgi:glutamate dehydrogenase/leucine dehydrogenase